MGITCEKHIHVADNLIMDDNQQSECEERGILEDYVQNYSPNVNGTATIRATSIRSGRLPRA